MRTPFFIWLARTSPPARAGILALSLAACNDSAVAPRALRRAPTVQSDSAITRAIESGEQALADLQSARMRRHSAAEDSLLVRRSAALESQIAAWRKMASSGRSLLHDEIETGALMEGIIVDSLTWTRVELTGVGGTPLVTIQTTLDLPAPSIKTATSGTSIVKGITYSISATFSDWGMFSYHTFRLPEVDCSRAGAVVQVSTWHQADWYWKRLTDTEGWARSNASDSCPPVAPIPHFTLSAQGNTEDNGGLFEVTAPKGGTVGVRLQPSNVQFDAPIKTYRWFKNGVAFSDSSAVTLVVSQSNTGILLEVTDGNGLKGTAEGVIALTYTDSSSPPPPPKPTAPADDPPAGGERDPDTTPSDPEPPPAEPVARYTCYEIFEKMRVSSGGSEYYFWQDMGRDCGWVDTYNRLPASGPRVLAPRSSAGLRAPRVAPPSDSRGSRARPVPQTRIRQPAEAQRLQPEDSAAR
jgi:hypothetical protein